MAGNCILRPPSPLLIPLWPRSKYQKPKAHFRISCGLSENPEKNTVKEESKLKRASLDLFQLSVTLTVVSASLPKPSSAAPSVSGKKRSGRKPEVFLNPEELRKWSKELPVVSHRLAYTEILDLKRENKLKHIVKPPRAGLKQRPEVVLVVLNDNKVVRAVLPSIESDPMFWEEWDGLKIDGLCMNAYSPAVKNPDVPKPLLGFLMKIPLWMSSLVKPKPQSKKALELKRLREENKRRKDAELAKIKEERERMQKEMKMQKKMEQQQKKKKELEELNDQNFISEMRTSARRSMVWTEMSKDSNLSLALGFLFFYIFYRTVVVNYKKQKKDYEDRLKIEKAEAEEKKRIKELEREMAGIDIGDDEEEGTKKEEDPYSVIAKQFMKSGALVRRVRSKRLPQYLERGVDVKFSDVAGLGKIRLELEEIVKFFTHGDMYRRRGVKIPGGILLCGSPGVGKTLLAKAVAGEAGVNFFSISASQFVEIYVGVGASRVRSLYQEAKENAPSVVFIDELDAVGRARGLIKGSGGQERDATLNQLLVCLDGFEGRGEVITIASTNRPDILDPALVRPGRFDRKIHIPKPGLIGRVEILQVHARKKPMAPDINYMAVAAITDGMVGAELANILEVAAINMMRDGRTEITTDDLLQAAESQERGTVDKKERSQDMWRQMAINEAAMAVVAVNFPYLRNIEFLTISPRAGSELGYTRLKLGHVKFSKIMLSRQSILDHITVQLAPRAADELIHGVDQLSTIWAETADNARTAARRLVLGGLSDKNYGLNNFWTVQKIDDIDTQALGILHSCYKRSKSILEDNMDLLHAVVHNLVEKKNLTKEEFFNLVELHGSLQPSPPTLFDIRSQKQLEHRNMLAHETRAAVHEHV